MSISAPDAVNAPPVVKTELSDEQRAARDRIYAAPLDTIDPAELGAFEREEMFFKFERLRAEQPVHYTPAGVSDYGDYWSITKWDDIVRIDTDPVAFSNKWAIALPTVGGNRTSDAIHGSNRTPEQIKADEERGMQSLLSMDPPQHGIHRGAVAEGVSPANLADLEPVIRERIGTILDNLPIGEEFDWVDKVSMELTAMTLATLFNYPQEDRRQLTYWSDVITSVPGPGRLVETIEERQAIGLEFFTMLAQLFKERGEQEPASDFMSLMAHSPHAKEFTPAEIYGDGIVLLVGGNDTTRNTLTGSVYALNRWPEQMEKLRENPALIPGMVSETIRWQTPLAHMSRMANEDVEVGGQLIRKGDKIALWYVSGNRDDDKIDQPNEFIIDRKNPRQHLSFGFGIHRCLGNRLAELQLRLTWEEILKRFPEINVIGEPERSLSNFVKGYETMTVVIPRRY